MKRKLLSVALFAMSIFAYAQIGVQTSTPQRTLHVNGSLQVVKELNVGGSENVQGTAGKDGEFLSSNGPGTAPTWRTIESQNFFKVVFVGNKGNISPATGSYTGTHVTGTFENLAQNFIYNMVNKIDNNFISYDANTGIFTVNRTGFYNIATYFTYDLNLNGTNETAGTATSQLQKEADTQNLVSAVSTGHGERTTYVYHQLTGIQPFAAGETFRLRCGYTQDFRLSKGNISISYLTQ
ncbi:hypothetical protein J2795_003928 [Chryseobacterium bernardetii]|jgi:hypothetical protein|uniref:C1q domain-containing protein n=3 Tax=Chryseobacterium TaxID=59732 RepID=A0A543E962_9FLAO|nr:MULTISPECIES: hypothetical protein [Chryseobacterium]MDR6371706.1 hypothetical protein [Chryseobacterium vietnamense]MDR6443194.1 hypothetical protein [Chryseobacterium bernardetii]MDR6460673.1 hypothetical protein [Chryseobacterium vietnamense]MDR6488647.1 hypothetical protein [Chryseobacterium vietnamense]TQM18125.1 hypothetical protein FB551_3887 [Chryseobacterium aquifrigidense]